MLASCSPFSLSRRTVLDPCPLSCGNRPPRASSARAGLRDPRLGDGHVAVGRNRAIDEGYEGGVTIAFPPAIDGLGDSGRRRFAEGGRHSPDGRTIVGADRAACEHAEQQACEYELP